MAFKLLDVTEIVMGMVKLGKIDANLVNPDDLYPDKYPEILMMVRAGTPWEDIVTKVGYSYIRDSVAAAENINGEFTPDQWCSILRQTASRTFAGSKLQRIARDLEDGREVDTGTALQALSMIDYGYRELTPMSEIVPEEAPWMETGYYPLDKHVGGLIKAGLTIIAAAPGIGKTTLALKIAEKIIKKNKKNCVAFFTLEMTMAQLTQRAIDLNQKLTKEEKSRLMLSEDAYNVNQVYSVAARTAAGRPLSAIMIDFADLLVDGEQSEAVMGNIYRTLALLAKKTGVPVLLVAQLNRETYKGGLPKINHIRYSGAAEQMAALILLVYNPHNILADYNEKSPLEAVPGRGYLIVGKSRFGFKEGGPGAIQVGWDGLTGWDDKSYGWFSIHV